MIARLISSTPKAQLFLNADVGGGTGGAGVASAGAELPGTEALAGSTAIGSPEEFEAARSEGLPDVWTEENAAGEEAEEKPEASAAETPVAEGAAPAPAAPAADPKAEERKGWPEAARKVVEETEKKVSDLTTQIEELRAGSAAPAATPTYDNPLSLVQREDDLAAHAGLAQQLKSWARKHLGSGGELPTDIQALMLGKKPEEITDPQVYTPEQVAELLDEAENMLERHIPARRQYLHVERDNESFLKEHYPQYLDLSKEEGKRFAAFERQFPQIKQFFPQWRGILAEVVRGSMAFDADAEARKAKKPEASKQNPLQTAPGEPIAPVPPGANGRGSAAPKPAGSGTPSRKASAPLRVNMDAEELAATL